MRAMPTVMIQATRVKATSVLWRVAMAPALRFELALEYLRALSPAAARCALLDGDGAILAGDPGLSPATDAVAAADGLTILVRGGQGGPRELLEFDARLAIAAVRGRC